MNEILTVVEGNTFMISNKNGDILEDTHQGLFHADTRFLSKFFISVNDRLPELLGSRAINDYEASIYATTDVDHSSGLRKISVVRDRFISSGVHEDLALENLTNASLEVKITIDFDADFADIFEVKRGAKPEVAGTVVSSQDEYNLAFSCEREQMTEHTLISFTQPAVINGKRAVFNVTIGPKETWQTCIDVCVSAAGRDESPQCRRRGFYKLAPALGREKEIWLESAPRFLSDNDHLNHLFKRSVTDLASLRLKFDGEYIIAAGMPWFMTLFGRDSLITAIESLPISLDLAVNVLRVLAHYQATEVDDFRDAEPGKILHEIRFGGVPASPDTPYDHYYGTVDATPLFLILLGEVYKWTADLKLLKELLPAAEAALAWIDNWGDLDGDGFVEYQRRSPKGLLNQGWKDSGDAIVFADGSAAAGPIALAEVQGYVYRAKLSMASLLRVLGREGDAAKVESQSAKLKKQFNDSFWLPDINYFALALDGDKRQLDSVTSNPGHCLWSGIVDTDKALFIADRLLAKDMFSGWGIRTLSTTMAAYNPVSYHNGSVWPHDNAIIAAGLSAYGFHDHASRVIAAMIAAGANLPDYRLPELFSGFVRRPVDFPVPYPTASAPQAWAAGAAILLLQVILGVSADPETRTLKTNPRLLEHMGEARLEGVRAFGQEFNLST